MLEQCSCTVESNGTPCKHQNNVFKQNPKLKYKYNKFLQRKYLHILANGTNGNVPRFLYALKKQQERIEPYYIQTTMPTQHADEGEFNGILELPEMSIKNDEIYKNVIDVLLLFSEVVLTSAKIVNGWEAWMKFFQHFKNHSRFSIWTL